MVTPLFKIFYGNNIVITALAMTMKQHSLLSRVFPQDGDVAKSARKSVHNDFTKHLIALHDSDESLTCLCKDTEGVFVIQYCS